MEENGSSPKMRSAFQTIAIENIDSSQGSTSFMAQAQEYTPDYERPPSRRPAADREDAFSLSNWLFEGVLGLIEEVQHHDLGLPEEFWVHATAAQREGRIALSIAIDELRRRANARQQSELERQQRVERRGDIEITF